MGKGIYKAPGGVIRVALEGDKIMEGLEITGDFFIFPEEALEDLEKGLLGVELNRGALMDSVRSFYEKHEIESPGIGPEDLVEAIEKAR